MYSWLPIFKCVCCTNDAINDACYSVSSFLSEMTYFIVILYKHAWWNELKALKIDPKWRSVFKIDTLYVEILVKNADPFSTFSLTRMRSSIIFEWPLPLPGLDHTPSTFHNDDEGHRICMVITLIMVEDSKAWSGWHGDNPIRPTRNTSMANF